MPKYAINKDDEGLKKLLMIALELPPCHSAGVQRTLKFIQYLPTFGWEPIVLTADPMAYAKIDASQDLSTLGETRVVRTKALNAAKHLSIKGKYLHLSQIPDKWWSWRYTAVPMAKKLIAQYKPDAIWSTYPVATAHRIAHDVAKASNLPWVADFRDPFGLRYTDQTGLLHKSNLAIETNTLNRCAAAVFTTDRSKALYQNAYPGAAAKLAVIENGYEEDLFDSMSITTPTTKTKFTLLHSGALYFPGRNPRCILEAVSRLKKDNIIDKDNFVLRFRGQEELPAFSEMINHLNIRDLVDFSPSIGHLDSLQEMCNADALLIIQDKVFENQIPGKIYEYIRTQLPILAQTTRGSATSELVDRFENGQCFDHPEHGAAALQRAIARTLGTRPNDDFARYSRKNRTAQLADLLNQLT